MIYLDHNATTPVLPEVRDAMWPFVTSEWGNPSSPYRFGIRAKNAVERARGEVAALVGAQPNEITFTSCATEANNSAINSALAAQPGRRHIVTSKAEHSSVLHYCEHLARTGYSVTFLNISREGMLDVAELEGAIRSDTAIVSLMWANNETGIISPVAEVAKICERRGVMFHCDAVQAAGKIEVDLTRFPIHFLSISGHKLGTPKGVGALVVREGVAFFPTIFGGKQEGGRRGGTENVPYIVGLGKACEIARSRPSVSWARVAAVRDEFEAGLFRKFSNAYRNGTAHPRLPNTSNFGIRGVDSDSFVTYCDTHGIAISSGSACMESAIAPSHVILAMANHETATEAIRVSLSLDSNADDLARLTVCVHDFLQAQAA
jgi:cysteine desulfurase